MRIIKLTEDNQESIIQEATDIIMQGGVVVTPSETQYGLSADPSNEAATRKVYALKQMEPDKPLGLIAGSREIIEENFVVNETEQRLMDKFWPGPLGLCLLARDNELMSKVAKYTLGNTYKEESNENKAVIRVTSDPLLSSLSKKIDLPLISTSANLADQPPCYDVGCVVNYFKNQEHQPDLIINAGLLEPKPGSTMLDLTVDTPVFIRQGAKFEEIQRFLNQPI